MTFFAILDGGIQQTDVESFFAQEQPEYVFHIAAKTGGVMLNKKYPVDYLTEGTYITLNVLQAANKYNAKGVVYVSSTTVYPEDVARPITEDMFMQGQISGLMAGYALSKTIGIQYCITVAQQSGKRFVAAVFPSIYGINDYGTTVVPMLIDRFANAIATNKRDIIIWGTGKVYKEFINSADAADALLFLMEHGENGKHYNVGSGAKCTIRELAETLKKISGFEGELVFDTSKPESAKRQFLNSSKIYNLGWRPKISFENGLTEVYQEHFQNIVKEQ